MNVNRVIAACPSFATLSVGAQAALSRLAVKVSTYVKTASTGQLIAATALATGTVYATYKAYQYVRRPIPIPVAVRPTPTPRVETQAAISAEEGLRKDILKLEQELDIVKSEKKTLGETKNEIAITLAAKEHEVTQLRREKGELEARIAAVPVPRDPPSEAPVADTEVSVLKTRVTTLEKDLEETSEKNHLLKEQFDTKAKELEKAEGEKTILQALLDEANKEIAELKGQLKAANEEIESLKTKLTEAEKQIETLEKAAVVAKDTIDNLKTAESQNTQKIQQLQKQQAELMTQLQRIMLQKAPVVQGTISEHPPLAPAEKPQVITNDIPADESGPMKRGGGGAKGTPRGGPKKNIAGDRGGVQPQPRQVSQNQDKGPPSAADLQNALNNLRRREQPAQANQPAPQGELIQNLQNNPLFLRVTQNNTNDNTNVKK